MNAYKRFLLISFCFLTACVSQGPAEAPPTNKVIPLEERKVQTAKVSSWDLKGALAAKNKSKGWSATMDWVQHGPNAYQIRLMGPLGGGTVLINKQGSTITFQDGSKRTTSTNAEELLNKETGIRLPVNNLYYWVRGLPAPGHISSEKHDAYNHLTQLKQSGYTIDFTKFTSVNGIDLPSMIRLEGNGVMIKVVIKSWSVL